MIKRYRDLTKKQKLLCSISLIFILLGTVLGTLIHTAPGEYVPEICFSVIALVFTFSLILFTRSTEWVLTCTALLCTVFADYFLIISDPQMKLVAMIFFSFTQICYFIRIFLGHSSSRVSIAHISVRFALIVLIVLLCFAVLGDKSDALSIVSVIYYANLIVNIAFAFGQIERSILFPAGLLLFALCDMLVGFSVLEELYVSVPTDSLIYVLNHSGFNFMWMFYVPSQMLIVLSLVKGKLEALGKGNGLGA